MSLLTRDPRSVLDVFALEGVDNEARSATVSNVGPARDCFVVLVVPARGVVVVPMVGASSAEILGEVEEDEDFLGLCGALLPTTSFFSACPNV